MTETAREALARWFGFADFRPGQETVVRAVLSGRDVLAVMPTGSGKSLCFQLPALMLPGTTLVVSPLIALMKDQVDALRRRRIPATFLNMTLTREEEALRLRRLRAGHYKLVYVAPERFRNAPFREALAETNLSMLTVDEAHCISAWGHDFRPDYLCLGDFIRQSPPDVRILATTATATAEVRRDILRHLALGEGGRPEPLTVVTGFSRPNLELRVTPVRSHEEKLDRVLRAIARFRCGIVYCATRRAVERVHCQLRECGVEALAYHGGMPERIRTRVQDAFVRQAEPVVVATNAFGMGVDRPDIRFAIHWDVPGAIEAYYQEVGRAGRDGAHAWCELLFHPDDVRTQTFFAESDRPALAQAAECYAAVANACAEGDEGLAALDETALAERSGLASPQAARSLISQFERAGLVRRAWRATSSQPFWALVPHDDVPALLKVIVDTFSEREAASRRRLEALLDYVRTPCCRHAFLLNYFGDGQKEEGPCGRCDRCLAAAPSAATADRLFDCLQTWARRKAEALLLPEHLVLPRAVRFAIACAQPETPEDLAGVPGVGERLLDTFGEEVLELARPFVKRS